MIGIYKIELDDRVLYVGQSKNIERRFSEHKSRLLKGKHANKHLQNIYNKYGFDKLKLHILEETDNLYEREIFWMEKLKPSCNLMIVRETDGTEHTDEWKLNMSINNPSKRPEIRKMRSIQLKKYNPTRDSSEVREKLRLSALKQFAKHGHPMIGRKLSIETKQKISDSQKIRLSKKA